jgi:hypothetical protein
MQTSTTSVPSGIEAIVCNDITQRQLIGIKKYGTTVAENPLSLRDWLQHAYEETLDQAVYLRRAIAEIDTKTELEEGNDCYRAIKELQKAIDKLNQKEDRKASVTGTVYNGTFWGARWTHPCATSSALCATQQSS